MGLGLADVVRKLGPDGNPAQPWHPLPALGDASLVCPCLYCEWTP